MSEFHLSVEMMFTCSVPSTDDDFDEFLDEVVNQLAAIGSHPSLAARLGERVADFAIGIEATDFSIAVSAFLADLRTALHAAGCTTATWPKFEATDHVVRELADA